MGVLKETGRCDDAPTRIRCGIKHIETKYRKKYKLMMKKLLKICAMIIIICYPFSVNAQEVKYSGGNGDGYAQSSSYENKGVPGSFSAGASVSAIQLTWQQNTDNDDVIIAYNTSNSFGAPQDGNSYSVNDVLSSGGTIIFNGSGTSFIHTGLSATTTYYYKAWSVSGTTYSTSGVTANAATRTLSVKYAGGNGDGYASATASSGVLPVELTSFEGKNMNNEIVLTWQTATEVNNYGFEIERTASRELPATSNIEWEKIGFVPGSGTTNSPKEYSFDDKSAPADTVQYRLKQIDTDGNFEYSQIVKVENKVIYKYALRQNYPNPFNPSTVITYQLPSESKVILKVYDILGRKVATMVNENQQAGIHKVTFSSEGKRLASGVYIYKIRAGSFTETKKMLLLK